jgi:N-methylhydantoinase A/oxoprolinase/acetone carboxylase beta subunit
LRLKIIACGVFERELEVVAGAADNEADVELLDAGLHAAPETLRLRAQEAIDAASASGRCDAVCLTYGLCGRGTAGLISRNLPLVVPRVHDCIALFLGSARAYAEQFARHPGTFYFTTGWYRHKAHPERTRVAAARRFDPETHPHFAELKERHGADNARYIVEFLDSWRRNYSRAALIDHGFATAEHEQTTRAVAEAAGWQYERLEGSLELLEGLLSGEWDEERFLVAPPGHVLVPTNDERILAAVPVPEGSDAAAALAAAEPAGGVAAGTFFYGEPGADGSQDVDLGLGIDAGGTYTDAVLYDLCNGALLDKAKALTTHDGLVRGIRAALGGLDPSLFERVSYTCLSTTLATNAIVEGRGLPVGLVLMPYHEGAAERIKTPLFRCVDARMNIQGVEERPVDEEQVLRAAEELIGRGAAAFAVSGYGAVRNPLHEEQVAEILRRHDLPIVCGHELSGRLNFVERAHTAVLNARLLPLVADLLRSVEHVLAAAGVGGPLFVVRGDGGIMHRDVARRRAVETVLSGPAASAVGGRVLTSQRDALVVDVGGTTTDIAVLSDGCIAVHPQGARVGHWRTSVAAADVQTSGLGGDSAVRPGPRGRLRIGPDRVVPLACLAEWWPGVMDELRELRREQLRGGIAPEVMDFFVLTGDPQGAALAGQEQRIAEMLAVRPHSRAALARACGCLSPGLLRVSRLERIGLVRRSGVTPTDALHVLGDYCEHDAEAARLGLDMLGALLGCDGPEAARTVKRELERQLALAIARRELSADGVPAGDFAEVQGLVERALETRAHAPFRLRWEQRRPVVGIGAPAAAFLRGACRLLGTEPVIPPHADVANAVGAVTAQVLVNALMRIRPSEFGGYVLYGPEGREEFPRLEVAEQVARERLVELVRGRARRFGTGQRRVRVDVRRRLGRLQDGSRQLLEVEVAGSLAGAPSTRRTAEA